MDSIVLKCSSSTDPSKLALGIRQAHRNRSLDEDIVITSIGAGAINQAIKAVILANKLFIQSGLVLTLRPSFTRSKEYASMIQLKILFENV